MTLGLAPRQADLFRSTAAFCDGRVAPDSIYGILHRECYTLFPDEMFADLFDDVGRRSVPPMIVAVVMVLQRIEGCRDRGDSELERFFFPNDSPTGRWRTSAAVTITGSRSSCDGPPPGMFCPIRRIPHRARAVNDAIFFLAAWRLRGVPGRRGARRVPGLATLLQGRIQSATRWRPPWHRALGRCRAAARSRCRRARSCAGAGR